MVKYISQDIASPALRNVHSGAESLEYYSTALIQRTAELRASRSKSVAAEKRRAMHTLLEQLQRLGVDYHAQAIQQLNQKDLLFLFTEASAEASILKALTLKNSMELVTSSLSDAWKRSDEYYFKLLARMITMRQVVTQPSRELSIAEVRKLNGFAEYLFHLVLLQRRDFNTVLTQLNVLQRITNSIKEFSSNLMSTVTFDLFVDLKC